jgi:hypothetical protein
VAIEALVRALVEQGRAVHEVAPQEQTLEDFYLAVTGGEDTCAAHRTSNTEQPTSMAVPSRTPGQPEKGEPHR